jgi:beta-galactosidase/beta-glucuronidase
LNLNGLWEYAIAKKDAEQPVQFDGKILVPFPIESALSGVMKRVGPDERLWYRRTFSIPDGWHGRRVMLRFEAVDWETTVWVNAKRMPHAHRGGYDPFSFDITDSLKPSGEQELIVSAFDPTDAGFQPRGKQIRDPHGIWYTPTTGIWQTVWLEPVPPNAIESVRTYLDRPGGDVLVMVMANRLNDRQQIRITVLDEGKQIVTLTGSGANFSFPLGDARLWTPDSPFLYDLKVELLDGGQVIDSVSSYFGLRTISLGKDEQGVTRMMLNGKFVFQHGPLDQGFWPDGLYTAPSDEALKYDIEVTKKLGFNMARKHVKVEPARWYYWCDKLGLLVWQDMPSGDRYIGRNDADITRSPESAAQFEREWAAIIESRMNHPSIVMWVPFNEGWGQFDTARIVDFTRKLDPTRLVDSASGWTDRGAGDVHDIHVYPGPGMPKPEEKRAAVLGEYGGLGLPLRGHTWQDEKNWGYRSFETAQALTDAYILLIRQLHPLIGKGLSAAVYTQTTDVEIEVNGLMTYDRDRVKMNAERITAANRRLFQPPPTLQTVIPSSQHEAQAWRYTNEKPGDDWFQAEFDDAKWLQGRGGFGTEGTPGASIRTRWATSDIWLRRTARIRTVPAMPWLVVHHDEDTEVYINGKLAAQLKGYTTDYVHVPIAAEAAQAIRAGDNTIAVHCRQTGGGQYIDVGLVEEVPASRP